MYFCWRYFFHLCIIYLLFIFTYWNWWIFWNRRQRPIQEIISVRRNGWICAWQFGGVPAELHRLPCGAEICVNIVCSGLTGLACLFICVLVNRIKLLMARSHSAVVDALEQLMDESWSNIFHQGAAYSISSISQCLIVVN